MCIKCVPLTYVYLCIYVPLNIPKTIYIPRGVFKRIANLTKKTPKNANIPLDQLYLRHAQTLKNANLNPPKYPSINKVNDELINKRNEGSKV